MICIFLKIYINSCILYRELLCNICFILDIKCKYIFLDYDIYCFSGKKC